VLSFEFLSESSPDDPDLMFVLQYHFDTDPDVQGHEQIDLEGKLKRGFHDLFMSFPIVIFLYGKTRVVGPEFSNLGGASIDRVFGLLFKFCFPLIPVLYRIEPSND
jgi:hypothetical protein